MPSQLFTPITLNKLTLPNRIAVSPMCQYSAVDGNATDWHMQHLTGLALSGAGLLMIEATAVEPAGRISHHCLGLYSEANETALGHVLQACRKYSRTPIGIQLAHAGRKGSAQVPWEGGQPLKPDAKPWTTFAPSALPYDDHWPVPVALDRSGMERIMSALAAAASRAARIGIDVVEIHAAHGYLLNEFFSPLSNRREDEYGGSLENRMRFPLECARAVRDAWPSDRVLGARISGSDWVEGGTTIEETVRFAQELKRIGYHYVCVTSGALSPKQKINIAPGYQVPFAAEVRAKAQIPTRAVGMIVTPQQAEEIIASGKADMVALARAFLDDPRWAWHAADVLGANVDAPPQYARGRAQAWPGAKLLQRA